MRNILLRALAEIRSENPRLNIAHDCERAICFRLGLHLSKEIKDLGQGFFVDSEYNIDISEQDSKRVPNVGRLLELSRTLEYSTKKSKLLIPDLIIHKRTENSAENFAVIEVKFKNSNKLEREFAEEKVRAIKIKYGYKYGLLVLIPRVWDTFVDPENIKLISDS